MGKKTWLRKITESAELYCEALPGVPLIEISGDDRVLIENYICVQSYCVDYIEIKMKFGICKISGERLILSQLKRDVLILKGKIDSVQLVRKGG